MSSLRKKGAVWECIREMAVSAVSKDAKQEQRHAMIPWSVRAVAATFVDMDTFHFPVHLRWADMDPNFHLRHDVYYALAAQARVSWLFHVELTPAVMQQEHFGPILFREECIFRREIHLRDALRIELLLNRCRADGSRWSIRHRFLREDGTACAELNVDGAWIDTQARKLTIPPERYMRPFLELPRAADFELQAPKA